MAKLLMGSIVVKAAGKINGHCFRIFRGQQLLTRLPLPINRNSINQNPAMNIIRNVFSEWSILDLLERTAWNNIAATNPIIDRFGQTKYLSGRDFYSKSNINARLSGFGKIIAFDWLRNVSIVTCNDIVVDITLKTITLKSLVFSDSPTFQFVAKNLSNQAQNPNPDQIKALMYNPCQTIDKFILFDDFASAGMDFNETKPYFIAFRSVTASGVVGPWLSFKGFPKP